MRAQFPRAPSRNAPDSTAGTGAARGEDMTSVRLAATSLALLLASPALANPGVPDPEGGTVIVVAPVAPVVIGGPSQVPPGAAEPAPVVAAAEPAPQNEAWSDVSHINGTPVPVGERGNYLYKWKKTNIASNPIGWMVGFYGLSISHALGNNLAIRGDANMIRDTDGDDRGYEFGVTAPLYLKRVYQGPFLEPGVIVRDFNAGDEKRAFVGPQVNLGWHWTFDSGLNLAVAFGLARRMNPNDSNSELGMDET